MCFFHDYDWRASVYDDGPLVVAGEAVRCYECRDKIHPGQRCRRVYMRECEECRRCTPDARGEWDDGYDGGELTPCPDDAHDYGEEFECFVCDRCQAILNAILEVEQEDGCEGAEAQPAFGELREAMWESDHAAEYIEHAAKENPELVASGHLDRFYKLTHEGDPDSYLYDVAEEVGQEWDRDDFGPVEVYGGEG